MFFFHFRLLDNWRTPVLPFSSSLWIGVITSYVVSVFAIKLLNYYNVRVQNDSLRVHETPTSLVEVLYMVLGIYVLQSVKMQ